MAAVALGTSVTPGANAQIRTERSGIASLPAGMAVYRNSNDKKVYLASDVTLAASEAIGFTVGAATAINQEVRVQWDGDIENCATLVVGEGYHLCDTPGSVDVSTAVATGDWATFMGFAAAATTFRIGIKHGRVQRA